MLDTITCLSELFSWHFQHSGCLNPNLIFWISSHLVFVIKEKSALKFKLFPEV